LALENFSKFPKQYIVLNANPIVCVPALPTEREKKETDPETRERNELKKKDKDER